MKRSSVLIISTAFLGWCVACVSLADEELVRSKLAPSNAIGLIDESDVILRAFVIQLSSERAAVLQIQEALQGSYEGDTVTLRWSAELHDQPIRERGEYVLFLKQTTNGDYTIRAPTTAGATGRFAGLKGPSASW